MSILTKEGIQKIFNDDWLLMDDCEGLENCTVIKELARMALAAMDSEPDCKERKLFCSTDTARMRKVISVSAGTEDAPLYRHAQPAPVVQENRAITKHFDTMALETAREILCDVNRRHEFPGGEFQFLSRIQCRIDEACRAAMLQAGTLTNEGTKQAGNSPVIPCAEQRIADAVELLKQAAPAMLADNGGPNGPLVGRLKSPAIPDGYVMVAASLLSELRDWAHPEIEEYCEMWAGRRDDEFPDLRKIIADADALLASAAHDTHALNSVQSVVTVSDAWIPVSERMPDDDDFVYIWPRPDFGVELHVGQYCECSPKGDGWYAQVYEQNYGIEWYPITVTHWMPLPADPQEVNHG